MKGMHFNFCYLLSLSLAAANGSLCKACVRRRKKVKISLLPISRRRGAYCKRGHENFFHFPPRCSYMDGKSAYFSGTHAKASDSNTTISHTIYIHPYIHIDSSRPASTIALVSTNSPAALNFPFYGTRGGGVSEKRPAAARALLCRRR
jgi:hypothetical protein